MLAITPIACPSVVTAGSSRNCSSSVVSMRAVSLRRCR